MGADGAAGGGVNPAILTATNATRWARLGAAYFPTGAFVEVGERGTDSFDVGLILTRGGNAGELLVKFVRRGEQWVNACTVRRLP